MPRLSLVDWGFVALFSLVTLTFLLLGDWVYAVINGPFVLVSFLFFRFVFSRRKGQPDA